MARKKVEKTPLSPKEAASKEFAMTSCVHSGDPSYRFEVGDSVSIGALKNCVVDEVCEDGKYYGIKYGKDGACYGYWSWLDVRPIPTSLEAKYAQKDSPLFRMSFSNRSIESLLHMYYYFGVDMEPDYQRGSVWNDEDTCDSRCRDAREEQYNAIVQKYDEKTVNQFAVLTGITMTALLENPKQDFLGTVYQRLGLAKSRAGQFFTPYNVGQMMARMNMPDSFVLNKSRIFQVNDPCCGAGCLLLAGYNAMREQLEPTDPDWDKYVLFVAQDIDPLVCKMCYIQMCCIGVPGVVVAGNSLFPDAERKPTDFWFTHKYFALDEKALENTYQQKKE